MDPNNDTNPTPNLRKQDDPDKGQSDGGDGQHQDEYKDAQTGISAGAESAESGEQEQVTPPEQAPTEESSGAAALQAEPGAAGTEGDEEEEGQAAEGDDEEEKEQEKERKGGKEEKEEKIVLFLNCRKANHKNQLRQMVCKTCQEEPTICVLCLVQDHNGHQVQTLEEEVVLRKARLDELVSSDKGLKSTKSELEAGRTRTATKRQEADKLRSKDLDDLSEAKDRANGSLKEDFKKHLEILKKNFDARQKAIQEEYSKAKKEIELKWDTKTAGIETVVQQFDTKLREVATAVEKYEKLGKPFDLLVLRDLKTDVTNAGKGLDKLQRASDCKVTSQSGPVDFSNLSSLTVEVVDKQVPAQPQAKVASKKTKAKAAAPAASGANRQEGAKSDGSTAEERRSLLVHGIPEKVDETDLEILFNSRKNGGNGDVDEVVFPLDDSHPHTARIFFDDPETIDTICSEPRKLNGATLRLEPVEPK